MKNNYIKNMNIVSFDKSKTWIEKEGSKIVFCKKTNNREYNCYIKMNRLLNNKTININNKIYAISTPNIYKYSSGVMYMEYFDGVNLELLLKSKTYHKKGVLFINKLIDFFINNKIYWVDFAPRNILISSDSIMIVDFEKGIMNKKSKVLDYLRNHVYEEYNLFLFEDERDLHVDIFKSENNKELIVDKIESVRYKCIAKMLGFNKTISFQNYLNILKMIIKVEEPYIKEGKIIYPGVVLDKIISKNINNDPITIYSKEVLKLYKELSN